MIPDNKKNSDPSKATKVSFKPSLVDKSITIGKLVIALDNEVKELEKGRRHAEFSSVTRKNEFGDFVLYEADCDTLPFDEDVDQFIFKINKKYTCGGSIQSHTNSVLLVALEEDFGPVINHLEISTGDGAMLTFLRDHLFDIHRNGAPTNFDMNHAGYVTADTTPKGDIYEINSNLNTHLKHLYDKFKITLEQEKIDAIEKGISSDYMLLWGPPGTGKTFTLGILLAHLVANGESVLITSNTNKAVDGALESVANMMDEFCDDVPVGKCLRLGAGITNELSSKIGDRVEPDKVLDILLSELREEKEEKTTRQNMLQKKLSPYLNWMRLYDESKHIEELSKQLLGEFNVANTNFFNLKKLKREHEDRVSKVHLEIKNAPEEATFFTNLKGQKTKRQLTLLQRHEQDLLVSVREKLDGQKIKLEQASISLEDVIVRSKAIKTNLNGVPGFDEVTKEHDRISDDLDKVNARLKEIESEENEARKGLIKSADVIATTVYKTFTSKEIRDRSFDTVVIDEASMSLLPLSYYSAARAGKRVIVVGDFRQLPAIVSNTKDDYVMEWIKEDPFQKSEIELILKGKKERPDYFVSLKYQRRMHDQINGLISKNFYNNELEVAKDQVGKQEYPCLPEITGKKRILYIDTSALSTWSAQRTTRVGRGSSYNVVNAALVADWAALLDENKLLERKNDSGDGSYGVLGIVTPFAAQRDLISQLLSGYPISQDSIGTAHKFQGSERDIIILDYVASTGPLSQFLKADAITDDSSRLLNVALSRAKHYLVVVGDFDHLLKKGGLTLNRVIKYIKRHGEAIDGKKLLLNSQFLSKARSKSSGLAITQNASQIAFDATNFYPSMTGDINESRKSISIYSPFMTMEGLLRWYDTLEPAIERGVRVKITTKTIDKQPNIKKYLDC